MEAWGGPEGLLRAKQAYARVARAISSFEPVAMAVRAGDAAEARLACAGKVEIFETKLDDSWARDIGPTFLLGPEGARACVAWQFNAWGNKYFPYADDEGFAARVAAAIDVRAYAAPLVCEGGAIHVDGRGHAHHHRAMSAQREPQSESHAAAGGGAACAFHRRAARDLARRRFLG